MMICIGFCTVFTLFSAHKHSWALIHLTDTSSECLKHFYVIGIMSEHIIFHWVWEGRQCLETCCVHSPFPAQFFFSPPEADGTEKISSAASAQMLFYALISEITSPSYQYVVSDKCCFCCCFCHLQFWMSDCSHSSAHSFQFYTMQPSTSLQCHFMGLGLMGLQL